MKEILSMLLSVLIFLMVCKYFAQPNWKLLLKFLYLRKHGILYKSEIIDYVIESGPEGDDFYFPVIQFNAKSGEVIQGKLSTGRSKHELRKSKFILIYSDEKQPRNFMEKSFEAIFLPCMGLLASVVGCGLAISFFWKSLLVFL